MTTLNARSTAATSAGSQDNLTFNEASFSRRVSLVGPVIETILGACTTATRVGKFKAVYVANTTNGVLWVTLGDSSVAAGSAVTTSIPVMPYGTVLISTGSTSTHVRASGAGLGFYLLADNIAVVENPAT
jgi:hypothetical protein